MRALRAYVAGGGVSGYMVGDNGVADGGNDVRGDRWKEVAEYWHDRVQDATYYGLCDVGGCGNSAVGPEIALRVPGTDAHLEVSLCADHPELASLIDRAQSGLT